MEAHREARKSSERGQALILLVLAFIGLLGFAALAIDGGMVYSDRRIGQNASDAAALAGAGQATLSLKAVTGTPNPGTWEGWDCSDAKITNVLNAAATAAINSASNNNFSIVQSNDPSLHNRVVVSCVNNSSGKYIDVDVDITQQTTTAFAHFVFKGPIVNTVNAVSTVFPKTPAGAGRTIVSLDTDKECKGQNFGMDLKGTGSDNIKVKVNGGGIHSNSCLAISGNPTVVVTGTIDYKERCDKEETVGGVVQCDLKSGQPVTPIPVKNNEVIPLFDVPGVCPSNVNVNNNDPGKGNISPGDYKKGISVKSGNALNMAPGLYCVYGGFTAAGKATITGSDVTIYVMTGGVSITGGGGNEPAVQLDAPKPGCEELGKPSDGKGGCAPAVGGMLFYVPDGSVMKLEGNKLSSYTGMIYAPYSEIDIGGTSELASYGLSMLGKEIKFHGTTEIHVTYLPGEIYHIKETLFLKR